MMKSKPHVKELKAILDRHRSLSEEDQFDDRPDSMATLKELVRSWEEDHTWSIKVGKRTYTGNVTVLENPYMLPEIEMILTCYPEHNIKVEITAFYQMFTCVVQKEERYP